MRELKDFLRFEFIGLKVEVIKSKSKNFFGVYGTIIDETKNTFVVETEKGRKIIPKAPNIFLFYFNDYWILIDGKLLLERPWERLKKRIRKII